MKRQQQGFTLLEVMVVLVIIGTLAALVGTNIIGAKDQSDKDAVVITIKQLDSALQQYRLDNGRYPTTEQGLQALVSAPTSDPVPRRYREGGYLNPAQVPVDPWGNEYVIVSPGEKGKIDIFSVGPDGQEGTDDDIGNWLAEQN